jgi:hypothetical protein
MRLYEFRQWLANACKGRGITNVLMKAIQVMKARQMVQETFF